MTADLFPIWCSHFNTQWNQLWLESNFRWVIISVNILAVFRLLSPYNICRYLVRVLCCVVFSHMLHPTGHRSCHTALTYQKCIITQWWKFLMNNLGLRRRVVQEWSMQEGWPVLCLQHTDDGRWSSRLISNDDSFCVDLNTKNVSERVHDINEKDKKDKLCMYKRSFSQFWYGAESRDCFENLKLRITALRSAR